MLSSRTVVKLSLGLACLIGFIAAPLEATAAANGNLNLVAKKSQKHKKAKLSKKHNRRHASIHERQPQSVPVDITRVAQSLPPKRVEVREPVVIPIQAEFTKLDPNL